MAEKNASDEINHKRIHIVIHQNIVGQLGIFGLIEQSIKDQGELSITQFDQRDSYTKFLLGS